MHSQRPPRPVASTNEQWRGEAADRKTYDIPTCAAALLTQSACC